MTDRPPVGPESVPRLVPHAKLRLDKARDTWTIQAPERTFMLDPIAHAIVSRCDGVATLGAIVDDLCRAFEGAPRDVIERDVLKLVQDFADKGVMSA
jgi:pyrroloquinoline quinone biosynthesis protein D